MTYQTLDNLLQGRNAKARKLGNNTYAKRHADSIAITLHGTDVLTFRSDGSVKLHTGGWYTATTKARISEYLPAGFSIYQKAHAWYIDTPNGIVPFTDGMTIQTA